MCKRDTLESIDAFYEVWEMVRNALKSVTFPSQPTKGKRRPIILASCPSYLAQVVKVSDSSRLKILSTKKMFQRLLIVIAQAKAGNISENLLNKNRQIMYSLYQAKEITKKVYNNIMSSI